LAFKLHECCGRSLPVVRDAVLNIIKEVVELVDDVLCVLEAILVDDLDVRELLQPGVELSCRVAQEVERLVEVILQLLLLVNEVVHYHFFSQRALQVFETDQIELVNINRVVLKLDSEDVYQKDDFRVLVEEMGALPRAQVALGRDPQSFVVIEELL
jgi:hypothetical protein